jgi:NADH dehydrogenase [ubiquinone] 1 alpha subcomplex assembly factor 7
MAAAAISQDRLSGLLRAEIAKGGPMGIDRYMALCLGHPQFGYYMTRDPFGVNGDFTTSPEVSQIFGELIGVWVAHVWKLMDQPSRFSLVELGPGRGMLMRDCLRAAKRTDGLANAAEIHFVETSPVLRNHQKALVPNAQWHSSIVDLPPQPSIIIANEFFDAIPIRQFERVESRVFERKVDWRDGAFKIVLAESDVPCPHDRDCIFEMPEERTSIAIALGHLLKAQGGAALVIDYGHRQSAPGDTLQAMRNHAFCGILETPGDADITSHVDFEALLAGFLAGGATVHDILTQGEFLTRMGIDMRTESLSRQLAKADRADLVAASKRLVDDQQMGLLFKVACATNTRMTKPYPFGDL